MKKENLNKDKFFIRLLDLMREFTFEEFLMPCDPTNVLIQSSEINRVGLELMGMLQSYDHTRILIMGESEFVYLKKLDANTIHQLFEGMFMRKPPVLILTKNLKPKPEIAALAKKYSIPVLISADDTYETISELNSFLSIQLAPRITRSAGLMNIHGEGVLIVGESGVGKSETAIELLGKGHKLISDDTVEIRKITKNTLMGSSPENTRHFIEVRGVGIINARRVFGIGAVKITERIEMVVNLEIWKDDKNYARMGTEINYTEILGVKLPYITIPVKPGRNLAGIIEVAAINNRQQKLGYNATRELFIGLGLKYNAKAPELEKCLWDI